MNANPRGESRGDCFGTNGLIGPSPHFACKDGAYFKAGGTRADMIATRLRLILVAVALGCAGSGVTAAAAGEFPFGLEMTLDAPPQPGAKRLPNLEIGDRGEVRLELWCKSGEGQFSVAGDTVVFVAGVMRDGGCSAQQIAADDALLAALSAATNWTRRGDIVALTGAGATLRFQLNTN